MNTLPPLRTVRDPQTPAGASSSNTPSPRSGLSLSPPGKPVAQLDLPSLPKPAREFVSELVAAQLMALEQVTEFVQKVGARATQLTSRERTADALNGLGFITSFVTVRALACQTHGLVFGPYRVLDRLSSGSIGVVFLAEHIRLRRKVALKTMPIDDTIPAQLLDRFESESRVLAQLDHPNIVRVFDIGTLPAAGVGLPEMRYQAQEYLPGGDVENYVYANGQQSIPQVCEWGRQIASALKMCHVAGLIHRDVKPSNLVLTEAKQIKLVDFGLVREYASVRTPSRILLGSLEFLAPEQVVEPSLAGPPADVYSLGATLFWLFTGHLPYPQTNNHSEALEYIRNKLPRRGRDVLPDLPKELDALLARMLARNPAERPSLNEVQSVLAQDGNPSGLTTATDPAKAIRQLEDELIATQTQLAQTRQACLSLVAAVAASLPGETQEHQKRVARFVRVLAPYLATKPNWPMMADPRQVDDYARAISAHELGAIVLGAGGQNIEVHTTLGDEILGVAAKEGSNALPFLRVLRQVVRHHHEHWSGTGFPDKLRGEGIPAPARLAALVITYDDLRRGVLGEKPLTHQAAARKIVSQKVTVFDPLIVEAFEACEKEFDRHFWEFLEPGMEPPAPGSLDDSSRNIVENQKVSSLRNVGMPQRWSGGGFNKPK